MTAPDHVASARSGVYRTPASVEQMRIQSQHAGLTWFHVTLDGTSGKSGIIKALAESIGAPADTFGGNWDALADVLQDLSWARGSGYVIRIAGAQQALVSPAWQTLLEILRDSAIYWKARCKPFVVLVDGGPELPPWT